MVHGVRESYKNLVAALRRGVRLFFSGPKKYMPHATTLRRNERLRKTIISPKEDKIVKSHQ